ncbi:hypothetical protein JA1_002822 [Spathaspora sp. JA1]|nr:hypothetical protein JA1_002822 [Spathaspora sp. JA1]
MKVSILLLFTLPIQITTAYQLYCRCDCNQNSIINPIEKCGLCTKEYCLNQDKNLCVVKDDKHKNKYDSSEKEKENIIISCFQVESFKDSLIIYSFIFTVLGLLAYAGYKTYIL